MRNHFGRRVAVRLYALGIIGGGLVAFGAGCGTGGAAEAIRPQAKTGAQALGEEECRDVQSGAKPLIVDWGPEKRMDLEVAMRDGVAIVSYDCKKLTLLSECKAEGSYGFKAVVLKQQLIRLEDASEIKANLPLSGAVLVAKLGAELERGTTLDLATALVGKKMSTRVGVPRGELKGQCGGATHFVRGAAVGAFVMQTGEKARVASAVEVFSAGASGKSMSSKLQRQEDGSVEACKKTAAESEAVPANCGSLIRLDLFPISEGAATSAPKPAAADEDGQACAAGLVFSEGKCVRPTAAATHTCAADDLADCAAQCDKNDAASCSRQANGVLKSGDGAKAKTLFDKACSLGHGSGCSNLGATQLKAGDAASAAKNFEKACSLGAAVGCFNLGNLHYEGMGVTKDLTKAASLYGQACNAGSADGCVNLGNAYDDGEGVTKDSTKAFVLFKRACEGDHAIGCTNLGSMYAAGTGTTADVALALKTWEKACTLGGGTACEYLGKRYTQGDGVTADATKGAAFLAQACKLGVKTACK